MIKKTSSHLAIVALLLLEAGMGTMICREPCLGSKEEFQPRAHQRIMVLLQLAVEMSMDNKTLKKFRLEEHQSRELHRSSCNMALSIKIL